MLRQLILFVLLASCIGECRLTSLLTPKQLVQDSTVIVIGKVSISGSTVSTKQFQDKLRPTRRFFASVSVDNILKAPERISSLIDIQWEIPTDDFEAGYGVPGNGSYMLLFLKSEDAHYTFTSADHPGFPAIANIPSRVENEVAQKYPDAQVLDSVLRQMCMFALSTAQNEDQRVSMLYTLYHTKHSLVIETAKSLLDDQKKRVSDAALFILLRFKLPQYLPRARERILSDARSTEGRGSAGNLILAVTQEFPEESVPMITEALRSNNAAIRGQIAYSARHTKSSRMIQPLLALIDDPDLETAWNAMHSLGELTDHLDWRPISREPQEWKRALKLWHAYAAQASNRK